MRLWVALSAVLVTFVAACGGAQAYTPPITMKVFPLAAGHPSGPMVAGLDGNMWLQEGNGVASAPAPRVAVLNAQGGVVKELAAGGAGALGPDGNFWFAYGPKVARMTPAGAVTYFRMTSSTAQPAGLTPGPDGNLWFFDDAVNTIYRISPAGTFTRIVQLDNDIGGIAFGPDGNLWATEFHPAALVARVTLDGTVTEFSLSRSDSEPHGITAGPDGNMWVAERHRNAVARVTLDGQITEFRLSRSRAGPFNILTGSDGNLWFSEVPTYGDVRGMPGRITPTGEITEFAIPPGSGYIGNYGPVAGPDGNMWLSFATSLGRLQVAQRPGVRYVLSQEAGYAPASASIQLGGTVQWNFYGPSPHQVADATGLGLFDSGPKGIASSFRRQLTTSGVYAYADPLHPGQGGKVTVAPHVGVSTGFVGSTPVQGIDAMWSIGPVTGTRVFDVQVRRPGETSYSDWKMGTTDDASGFAVDVPGTYSVRVRMRDTATGAKTGYASRAVTAK